MDVCDVNISSIYAEQMSGSNYKLSVNSHIIHNYTECQGASYSSLSIHINEMNVRLLFPSISIFYANTNNLRFTTGIRAVLLQYAFK